jgi:hypothetical protein
MDGGVVFGWKGKLYRAMRPRHDQSVRDLFGSGLIDALVKEGLFVPSFITDLELDGYGLVIEHQIVHTVSYPHEWSFSMLMEAASLVLRINEASIKYGYQTKDCHCYNVLFSGESPVYVDLGSFTPILAGSVALQSLDEYLRAYYYPLRIWASLGPVWGKKAVQRPGFLLSAEDYLRCRWPVFRWPAASTAGGLLSLLHKLLSVSDDVFAELRTKHPAWKARLAQFIRDRGKSFASIDHLKRRLRAIERQRFKTPWADYHDSFSRGDGGIGLTPRFQYIADLLESLDASSVLEVAANQGILSRSLRRTNPGLRVISTDLDETAVDKGFCASRRGGMGINWAVLDPFFTERHSVEDDPATRFQSEAVVALALTHHLILTLGLSPGWILDVLSAYSRKYLLVEFMPLGLFDGKKAPPVPSWYTVDWFQREFECRLDLVRRVQLEDNRILFVGTKKKQVSAQSGAGAFAPTPVPCRDSE